MLRCFFSAAIIFVAADLAHAEIGIASWYDTSSCARHPCRTANGERYTGREMSAAHRTLPFGTRVKVCRLPKGECVVVRINDFGPAARTGRIIDLSKRAAEALGIIHRGVARVRVERVRVDHRAHTQLPQNSR